MGGGARGDFGNTLGQKTNSKQKNRLFGKPGEIITAGNVKTKIGADGRAIKERHFTDHGNPKYHSNPHDHEIVWSENGNPIFTKAINYWDSNIPKF